MYYPSEEISSGFVWLRVWYGTGPSRTGQVPGQSSKVSGELECEAGKLKQNPVCETEATLQANGWGAPHNLWL